MGLASASQGMENRVSKGRGVPASATGWAVECDETSKKGRGYGRKPSVSRIARRTFALAMRESGRQEGKFADRGLPLDLPQTKHAPTALSSPPRAIWIAHDASPERLLDAGTPLSHPVFEPATGAMSPAAGRT
jgi:hypothetical protein